MLAHYLTVPVIRAYHKRRAAKLRKRAMQLGLSVKRRGPDTDGNTAAKP